MSEHEELMSPDQAVDAEIEAMERAADEAAAASREERGATKEEDEAFLAAEVADEVVEELAASDGPPKHMTSRQKRQWVQRGGRL